VLVKFTRSLQRVHQSWRSRHIISQLTPEQQAAIRMKIVGYTLLGNRTKHWGIGRAWHGDYLGQHALNNEVDLYNQGLMNLRATGAVSQVLFSTMVFKLSHRVRDWRGDGGLPSSFCLCVFFFLFLQIAGAMSKKAGLVRLKHIVDFLPHLSLPPLTVIGENAKARNRFDGPQCDQAGPHEPV
jgi:hypothetical protein